MPQDHSNGWLQGNTALNSPPVMPEMPPIAPEPPAPPKRSRMARRQAPVSSAAPQPMQDPGDYLPYAQDPYAQPPQSGYGAQQAHRPARPNGYDAYRAYPPEDEYDLYEQPALESYYGSYQPAAEQSDPFTPYDGPEAHRSYSLGSGVTIDPDHPPKGKSRPFESILMLIMAVIFAGTLWQLVSMTNIFSHNDQNVAEWQKSSGVIDKGPSTTVRPPAKGETYQPTQQPVPEATAAPELQAGLTDMNGAAVRTIQTPEPYLIMLADEELTALRKEYPDIVGSLEIAGKSEQIMLNGTINYHTRDSAGNSSKRGSVYCESYLTNKTFENLILRGQASAADTVFYPLRAFTDAAAFSRAPQTAQLNLLYEQTPCYLFAVIVTPADASASDSFDFSSHASFPSDEAMMAFVNEARSRSLYPFSVDVQPTDRLLTLAALGETDTVVLLYRLQRDGEQL